MFAKNRQVRDRLRINGMKRSKKKENAGKSSCSQFVERQLHKHRGAFQDNQTMTKNKKQKPHQGSAPISQLSEKTEKTESNLNKCINTGIVFRVILGLTVEFVNKSLDS